MDSEHLRRLARVFYDAPTPTLMIGPGGRIVDYNLALEILLGDTLNGRRDGSLGDLLRAVRDRVIEGDVLPRWLEDGEEPASAGDGDGGHAEPQPSSRCAIRADDLGFVRMACTVTCCREPAQDGVAAYVAHWDVTPEADPMRDRLHALYLEKLEHQYIWQGYARSYDIILGRMPYYREVVDRHVAALTGAGEGPLLDLGAGTGNLVERLIAGGRRVVAVENSRAMLDRLRAKSTLAPEIGRRLRVIEASAEFLPFLADESFQGVSILLALFDMDEPERAFHEAVRVLRPGGVLVITDLKPDFQLRPILAACEEHLRRLGQYEQFANDLHRVVKENNNLDPGSRSSFHVVAIQQAMRELGFVGVEMADSHFGQCATVVGRKPETPPRT